MTYLEQRRKSLQDLRAFQLSGEVVDRKGANMHAGPGHQRSASQLLANASQNGRALQPLGPVRLMKKGEAKGAGNREPAFKGLPYSLSGSRPKLLYAAAHLNPYIDYFALIPKGEY